MAKRTKNAVAAPHNWGATVEEMSAPCDGDALVDSADHRMFRALTVQAAATRVFRWLCQLRVAPYSYDALDNFGRQSPRELSPGLEALEVGQRFMRIFELHGFEPEASITLELSDARARRAFGDLAVTYRVEGDAAPTRLIATLVVHYPPTMMGAFMRRVLPWGDLIMMRKQLLTLKRFAERDEERARAKG